MSAIEIPHAIDREEREPSCCEEVPMIDALDEENSRWGNPTFTIRMVRYPFLLLPREREVGFIAAGFSRDGR